MFGDMGLSLEEMKAAEKLADKLGVQIKENWHIVLWSLPMLQELTDRVKELEIRLHQIEVSAH